MSCEIFQMTSICVKINVLHNHRWKWDKWNQCVGIEIRIEIESFNTDTLHYFFFVKQRSEKTTAWKKKEKKFHSISKWVTIFIVITIGYKTSGKFCFSHSWIFVLSACQHFFYIKRLGSDMFLGWKKKMDHIWSHSNKNPSAQIICRDLTLIHKTCSNVNNSFLLSVTQSPFEMNENCKI